MYWRAARQILGSMNLARVAAAGVGLAVLVALMMVVGLPGGEEDPRALPRSGGSVGGPRLGAAGAGGLSTPGKAESEDASDELIARREKAIRTVLFEPAPVPLIRSLKGMGDLEDGAFLLAMAPGVLARNLVAGGDVDAQYRALRVCLAECRDDPAIRAVICQALVGSRRARAFEILREFAGASGLGDFEDLAQLTLGYLTGQGFGAESRRLESAATEWWKELPAKSMCRAALVPVLVEVGSRAALERVLEFGDSIGSYGDGERVLILRTIDASMRRIHGADAAAVLLERIDLGGAGNPRWQEYCHWLGFSGDAPVAETVVRWAKASVGDRGFAISEVVGSIRTQRSYDVFSRALSEGGWRNEQSKAAFVRALSAYGAGYGVSSGTAR